MDMCLSLRYWESYKLNKLVFVETVAVLILARNKKKDFDKKFNIQTHVGNFQFDSHIVCSTDWEWKSNMIMNGRKWLQKWCNY